LRDSGGDIPEPRDYDSLESCCDSEKKRNKQAANGVKDKVSSLHRYQIENNQKRNKFSFVKFISSNFVAR